MDFTKFENSWKEWANYGSNFYKSEYGVDTRKIKVTYPKFRENANLDGVIGYYIFLDKNKCWYNYVEQHWLYDNSEKFRKPFIQEWSGKLFTPTKESFAQFLVRLMLCVKFEDLEAFVDEMFEVFDITEEMLTEVEELLKKERTSSGECVKKEYELLDLLDKKKIADKQEKVDVREELVDSNSTPETITVKLNTSYKGINPQNLTKEFVGLQKKLAKVGEERETILKHKYRVRGHPEIQAA